jgi:hypothetical protein
MLMARALCDVMTRVSSVNFIGPDAKTRVGAWLLLNSHDEVPSSAGAIERGRGWPASGYELRPIKDVGKYPRQRLIVRKG